MADPVFRSAYDFLAPSPDANYGSVLPFAYNREGSPSWVTEGSNPRFAMPEWLRSAAQGVVGLGESTQTGSLTPEALATLTMGSVGTGATLGARGALASGASKPSIRAYHGSPHDFDRFDLSKIGTGEGAQAYGHGLYFAENEGVARSYKNPSSRPVPVTYGDAVFTDGTIRGRTLNDIELIGKDAALQKLRDNIRFNENYAPDMANLYKSELEWASGVDPSKIKINRGHMYEVDIHADPAKMLDWDKPLSGQSAPVKSLDDLYWGQHAKSQPDITSFLKSPEGAVAAKELGIPGIRYLDAGSRTAGQGSSNYVVFDPQTIEILRKYGFAVPSPAVPGFNAAPQQQPPQAPGFRVAKDMVY